MPIGMLYWFLFILWILFGGWVYQPTTGNWRPFGGHLLLGLLLFLLGWHVFGFVIKG